MSDFESVFERIADRASQRRETPASEYHHKSVQLRVLDAIRLGNQKRSRIIRVERVSGPRLDNVLWRLCRKGLIVRTARGRYRPA